MENAESGYARIVERFVAWAQTEPSIRGAIVIGSRARSDHPADEWSDLDIIVFADDPGQFISSGSWLENLGRPLLTFVEPTIGGASERRVLFAGGLDVDFVLLPAALLEPMLNEALPPDVADMLRRGVRILVDKDGFLFRISQKPRPTAPGFERPPEAKFLNSVHDFWYHTLWTVKHLRRGEVWWAKGCCDGYLKGLLLQMLEWHAHAARGPEFDTWMRGRFLEEWADPRAVAALPDLYSRYAREEIGPALLATMKLYSTLAQETAHLWGYSYPFDGERAATELTKELLEGVE